MSSRRQRSIPLGGRYRQISLYKTSCSYIYIITVTSWWARWRLKSPASRLPREAQRHWPLWGIGRWPVNSPHKGPVTRKMFPFDDVFMIYYHYAFLLDDVQHNRFLISNAQICLHLTNYVCISFPLSCAADKLIILNDIFYRKCKPWKDIFMAVLTTFPKTN